MSAILRLLLGGRIGGGIDIGGIMLVLMVIAIGDGGLVMVVW